MTRMTIFTLGINTGFALNRFPEPAQWLKVVGETLNLRETQLTADLLNPSLPQGIIEDEVKKISRFAEEYGVKIFGTMTGAFTRVNHFSHPNEKIRNHWLEWFKKFVDVSVALGADNTSSHLGIMSYEDAFDKKRSQNIFQRTINAWVELSEYAKDAGMNYLSWEPMSIKREYGETIAEAKRISSELNKKSALPVLFCLDVDHGDVTSQNPDDYDPYAWLKEFAAQTPILHLKQSTKDKHGHHPFTKEKNEQGAVEPAKVLKALKENAARETHLVLELSFREREPADSLVLKHLKESVDYWKQALAGEKSE